MEHPYIHPSICPFIPLSVCFDTSLPFRCSSFSFVIIFLRALLSFVGPNNPVSLDWFFFPSPSLLSCGSFSSAHPPLHHPLPWLEWCYIAIQYPHSAAPSAPSQQHSPPYVRPSNSARSLFCLLDPPSSLPVIIKLTFPRCRESNEEKEKHSSNETSFFELNPIILTFLSFFPFFIILTDYILT